MEKIIIFCILIFLSSSLSRDQNEYDDPCFQYPSDENKCFENQLDIENYQCCIFNFNISILSPKICAKSISPTPEISKFKDIPEFTTISKEVIGFTLYGNTSHFDKVMPIIEKFPIDETDINIKCQDGGNIDIKYERYSEEDKSRLKSKDHCLYYTYLSLQKPTPKLDCKNGILTQTAEKDGFSCGYYNFQIKSNNSDTIEYQTCFLFNKDVYGKIIVDEDIKDGINQIVKDITSDYSSFKIDIYDGKGNEIKYDSETSQFVVNRSNFLYISKLLLISSILLF